MDIIVCDFYKLAKAPNEAGKLAFTQQFLPSQKPKRTNWKITQEYFDEINNQWEENGELCIEDKEATKKFIKDHNEQVTRCKAIAAEKKKSAGETMKDFAEAMVNVNKPKEISGSIEERPDNSEPGEQINKDLDKVIEPIKGNSRDLLKAEADKLGIKYPSNIKTEKLHKLIEDKR